MAGKIVADTLEHSTAGSIATNYVVNGSAKVWVNFNGAAATLSPRDSFNTSSLTDVGTGQHKVLFTNNMNNAVYHGMATSGCNLNGNSYTCWTGIDITASGTGDTDAYTSKTTSEVQICNLDGGNNLEDSIDMNCILHGDLA